MRRGYSRDDQYERINTYFPPHPPLPWQWLDTARENFVQPISAGFGKLLRDSRCPETKCTSYLGDHAGFFLCEPSSSFFALREIRLGSDFVIDLAVPHNRFSLGLRYDLIEMEPCQEPPFKRNGDKSTRLSHAIDQIENWRRWLNRHARMARDLFPCWFDSSQEARFTFTIIIGTRENTKPWIQKRNQISDEYRISIRSHDWLLDLVNASRFSMSEQPYIGGSEQHGISPIIKNALGNPFFKAWSDSEWKTVRQEMSATSHFFVWNADAIIQNRTYNSHFEPFLAYCNKRAKDFPTEVKFLYDCWRQKSALRPDL